MKLGNAGKIGISWAALVGIGVYSFVLSKRSVDKKRYEHMKVRERMKNSNIGEYPESERKFSG